MSILEYLNNNVKINMDVSIENVKSKKHYFYTTTSGIKEVANNIFKKNNFHYKIQESITCEYIEDINSIIYKQKIFKNTISGKEIEKTEKVYAMTPDGKFYYYINNKWEGPYLDYLFPPINNFEFFTMVSKINNLYYITKYKTICYKNANFYQYNYALKQYLPGFGLPFLTIDSFDTSQIVKPINIDNTFEFNITESEICYLLNKYPNKEIIYFAKIQYIKNKDYGIRFFLLNSETKKCIEVYRTIKCGDKIKHYINYNNYFIERKNHGIYYPNEKGNSINHSSYFYQVLSKINIEFVDNKVYENTNFKYYKDILTEHLNSVENYIILDMFPGIEQLFKIKLTKIAEIFLNIIKNDLDELITSSVKMLHIHAPYKTFIPEDRFKTLPIFALNKYQLNEVKKYLQEENSTPYIIYFLKKSFNKEILSDIDNKTFDIVFDKVKKINLLFNKEINFYEDEKKNKQVDHHYIIRTYEIFYKMSDKLNYNKSFEILEKFSLFYNNNNIDIKILAMYYDTLNMLAEIELLNEFDLNVTDEKAIAALHDDVVEIFNSVKIKFQNEKFAKQLDKIKHLEFENENYKIVIPKHCEDLVNEGKNLHHCVGTYINSVIKGNTNIIFIRKKENLEESYFTVEISNENKIIQIHGMMNCDVKDKKLKQFIEEWMKLKKITLKHKSILE